MRKALQAPGHPLGQLDRRVKVGQAALDFLGLGAVAQHKVSQEVEQEKGHQVGIVMVELDCQLVQGERVDWEVAQVSMSSIFLLFPFWYIL